MLEQPKSVDVLIVGAGLAGLALASFLSHVSQGGLRVAVVDSGSKPSTTSSPEGLSTRCTALSYGTQNILSRFKLWDGVANQAQAIDRIHVSEAGRFSKVRLASSEQNVSALGYVIENHVLGQHLLNTVEHSSTYLFFDTAVDTVQVATDTNAAYTLSLRSNNHQWQCSTRLLVIASGANDSLLDGLGIQQHKFDYQQSALTMNIATSEPHKGIAFERFTQSGAVAVLPLTASSSFSHRANVVWTLSRERLSHIQALSDEALRQALQEAFGWYLGRIVQAGQARYFPIHQSMASEQVRTGLVVVGNAAHTLHPVAGQGFNLIARDLEVLVDLLSHNFSAIGNLSQMQTYHQRRLSDQTQTMSMTHHLLGSEPSGVYHSALRQVGMLALSHLPALRKVFAREAMGIKSSSYFM